LKQLLLPPGLFLVLLALAFVLVRGTLGRLVLFVTWSLLLVTDAWHMPRALAAFERAGVDAVPAPTYFVSGARRLQRAAGAENHGWREWLPQAAALYASYYAIHELLGAVYYELRADLGPKSQAWNLRVDPDQLS
ncbi:MAG: ElyC/SanA/YdcF family protein, partial [Thiohalocapsa sp.]